MKYDFIVQKLSRCLLLAVACVDVVNTVPFLPRRIKRYTKHSLGDALSFRELHSKQLHFDSSFHVFSPQRLPLSILQLLVNDRTRLSRHIEGSIRNSLATR